MKRYSIEPRTRKYGVLSFTRNLSNKYAKQLLDGGLDVLKTASIEIFQK